MHVVVIGHGMVGSRFVDELVSRTEDASVTVLGAEHHEPYNRVLLSELVAGRIGATSLTLPAPANRQVTVHRGVAGVEVDRHARTVTASDARVLAYDVLVLATGARARIPDITGLDPLPAHVHPLRTVDDAHAIVAAARTGTRAVVIGAGVLGLEVVCGLAERGLEVTLVHGGPHLMDRQLDADAARAVEHGLQHLGIAVRVGQRPREVVASADGVSGVLLPDGEHLATDLLVLSTGTVPETDLAARAGLAVGRGIVVGPDGATSDPAVFAIGDCAQPPEGGTGLIAQGWDQARRLAAMLADPSSLPGLTPNQVGTDVVRLKAHGLEVVTMGISGSAVASPGAHRAVRLSDPATGRHVEVVVAAGVVVGATCVGASTVAADLTAAYTRQTPVPSDPAQLLLRPVRGAGTEVEPSVTLMPDRATICRCNGVTKGEVSARWTQGARTVEEIALTTRATTGCGGCTDAVCGLLEWLAKSTDPPEPEAEPSGAMARRAQATSSLPMRTLQTSGPSSR